MSQKVLDRIQKLIAKVRPSANATEEEARSAAHRVCLDILEHGIVLALPRTTARDGAPRAPHAPPWARNPYNVDPFARERAEWARTPPPAEPADSWDWEQTQRPPDPEPMSDAERFADYINGEFAARVREAERRAAERAMRDAQARATRDQFDDELDHDKTVGGSERRRMRHRAWSRAGRPTRQVYDAPNDRYVVTPDYRGLDY